ncbi:hypothetical protein [Mastigocladopsis repens]|uniref:hypothetical protein n=1 Tax=Mastigocladopsis repens TaxID=221287 RepID=UPI0008FBD71D|nr:hypothetical protein [Mastigocladopsis repens]
MASANRATSLVVNIHDSKRETPRLWEPVRLGKAMLTRLWWDTKAYGTVFIIGLLTLLSLMFLRIHWTYRKLLLVSTHQGVGGHKWHTFSRKSLD